MATRTITLTGRRPVKINEDQWPVIAASFEHDGEVVSQANRRAGIKVRQNKNDGRTLVYGFYSSLFPHEPNRAGGELLAPPEGAEISPTEYLVWDEIPAAIRRVGEYLDFDDHLIDACIADLPAEEV